MARCHCEEQPPFVIVRHAPLCHCEAHRAEANSHPTEIATPWPFATLGALAHRNDN